MSHVTPQGSPDEVNNALLNTTRLHADNKGQCPIATAVPRDVAGKVDRAAMSILGSMIHRNPGATAVRGRLHPCHGARTPRADVFIAPVDVFVLLPCWLEQGFRKRAKSAMRGGTRHILNAIARAPLDDVFASMSPDARKSVAFQLGQAQGLLAPGVELYTKSQVRTLGPATGPCAACGRLMPRDTPLPDCARVSGSGAVAAARRQRGCHRTA